MAFTSVAAMVTAAQQRNPRAIGRLISMVENNSPHLREAMTLMAPHTGHCHVVGLTGSPGVGKSTSTMALIGALRRAGQRVGVLAIDPSSPFSGGAVLGDRIRMQKYASDPDVFIRSMASRGHLGGLSAAATQALRVYDTAGFDTVLVETVGVGQSEVEIASAADTTIVLNAPGMGDSIQAAKAGILEIADILVINKADREGVPQLRRELRSMVALADHGPDSWIPPIVETIAHLEQGVDRLMEEIQRHAEHGHTHGQWDDRRLRRAAAEVESLVLGTVRTRIADQARTHFNDLAESVRDGLIDPYSAADQILSSL